MKINKKNFIIPALMTSVGMALVGSITGTFAWYQYSTRVQAAFIGQSVNSSENMQIKVESGAWQQNYKSADLLAAGVHDELKPVTTGAMDKEDAMPAALYGNPVYQYANRTSWKVATANVEYVQFDMYVRVIDVDGATTASYLDKEVYLVDLTIQDATSGKDLSSAVRVHFHTDDVDFLMAKAGSEETSVYGKLDLNNDGEYDEAEGYEWDTVEAITYGDDGSKQKAYGNDVVNGSEVMADDTTAALSGGKSFGSTTDEAGLKITVTIWLEGWQLLAEGEDDNKETADTAVWKASTYIGEDLQIGMRFAVPAE